MAKQFAKMRRGGGRGLALAILTLPLAGCGRVPQPREHTREVAESGGQTKSSPLRAFLFYVPNRLVDLTDEFSLGVGIPSVPYLFPASAHANVHATRAVQVGAGSTHGIFLGKGYKRRFSWGMVHHELSLGPLTLTELKLFSAAMVTETSAAVERTGMLAPTDEPFAKGLMDYWALGAHVGLLPVALSADIHPVELADAILGFFLIDLCGDDY